MKKLIICLFIAYSLPLADLHAQVFSTSSNKPSTSSSPKPVPEGRSVYGVFFGRTPCQELISQLGLAENADCAKRKMSFVLYQDSLTLQPTFYEIRGVGTRSGKGTWKILSGTPTAANATVFQLEFDATTSLFLLKGDDNVLFFLDKKKELLSGNGNYSYTMNRVRN